MTQLLLLQDINNKMNSVIPQLTKKIKKIEEKNRNLEREICDLKKYLNNDKCIEPILLTNDSKNVGIYISISKLNELKISIFCKRIFVRFLFVIPPVRILTSTSGI